MPPRASPGQCHYGATCSLPTHQTPELNISATAELLPQELQEITFLEGVAGAIQKAGAFQNVHSCSQERELLQSCMRNSGWVLPSEHRGCLPGMWSCGPLIL